MKAPSGQIEKQNSILLVNSEPIVCTLEVFSQCEVNWLSLCLLRVKCRWLQKKIPGWIAWRGKGDQYSNSSHLGPSLSLDLFVVHWKQQGRHHPFEHQQD